MDIAYPYESEKNRNIQILKIHNLMKTKPFVISENIFSS